MNDYVVVYVTMYEIFHCPFQRRQKKKRYMILFFGILILTLFERTDNKIDRNFIKHLEYFATK